MKKDKKALLRLARQALNDWLFWKAIGVDVPVYVLCDRVLNKKKPRKHKNWSKSGVVVYGCVK